MAHQSGYAGSLTLSGFPSAWTGTITEWHLTYKTKYVETTVQRATARAYVFVAGDTNPFTVTSDWDATVTFLPADNLGSTAMAIGTSPTVTLKMNTNDTFSGTGMIYEYSVSDPLDGPVSAVCRMKGNGALTHASG